MLIVGAGFAGLSTAYHLAKNGVKNIVVLEKENKLGGHASGRNAGMIRQAVADPALAVMAIEGAQALRKAEANGWNLDYSQTGALFLSDAQGKKGLEAIRRTLTSQKVRSLYLSQAQGAKRVRILSGADFSTALFCPSDAKLDIEKLLRAFLSQLKKMNVRILLGHEILSVKKNGRLFKIRTGRAVFESEILVNAAGAWATSLAQMAGASRMPLKAYRRHLFESSGFKDFKSTWPYVWHLDQNFYFRPLKKELLLSPCDKTLCKVGRHSKNQSGEAIDPSLKQQLLKKMSRFSSNFKDLKLGKAKSGLRTMAPDGRFVIGQDPKLSGFYWAAGLGGHGVTTSFSVGRLTADLILEKKVDAGLAAALSPRRFKI